MRLADDDAEAARAPLDEGGGSEHVRWFSSLRLQDVPLVGGKNASLGEMYANLADAGVRVPNGFALTAEAYRDALTAADAWPRLHALLDDLDVTDVALLAERARDARHIVYNATGIDRLRQVIAQAYQKLEAEYGPDVSVAVRSSATAEDLPTASFAGQSLLTVQIANEPAHSTQSVCYGKAVAIASLPADRNTAEIVATYAVPRSS